MSEHEKHATVQVKRRAFWWEAREVIPIEIDEEPEIVLGPIIARSLTVNGALSRAIPRIIRQHQAEAARSASEALGG